MEQVRLALCAASAAVIAALSVASPAQAFQARFNVGDRVECNSTQIEGRWDAGTVANYTDQDRQLDPRGIQSGRFYRVDLDKYPAFLNPVTCMADFIRPGGATTAAYSVARWLKPGLSSMRCSFPRAAPANTSSGVPTKPAGAPVARAAATT